MRTLSSAPPGPRSTGRELHPPVTAGGFLTIALLGVVLFSAPLVLGAARLWFELPLLELVGLLLLLQAGRLGFGAPRRVRLDLIDLAVVAFTAYAVARWLTSPTEYFSRLEILNVVGYATVFFTCRYGLARRSYGLVLVGLLVVLGVFESGFGYYLSNHLDWLPFGPNETLHRYYAPRWIGTFASPNHYGSFLVMSMGAALAFGAFSKFSWPVRIVFFYLAALILAGIIFSVSRGSMLAACASIAALSIFGVRYGMVRWWLPVAAGVLLIGGFVLVLSQSRVVQSRLDEVRQTINEGSLDRYFRIKLARDALRIAADHPIFGTGPATFVYIHPRYQDNTFSLLAVLPHDDYLNTLDDYGGVGLGLALFFVVAVTGKFFRRLRASSRWQDRVLLAAGFTAWSALLVHSFLDYNLHIPATRYSSNDISPKVSPGPNTPSATSRPSSDIRLTRTRPVAMINIPLLGSPRWRMGWPCGIRRTVAPDRTLSSSSAVNFWNNMLRRSTMRRVSASKIVMRPRLPPARSHSRYR